MNENAQPQRGGVGHFVPLVRPKLWQWMPVATSFRVDVVLGLLSRGHGMKVRLSDLTLNVLEFYCCLVICFRCLCNAFLLNTLTVHISFVFRRHNRPLDVSGGRNGFGELRV